MELRSGPAAGPELCLGPAATAWPREPQAPGVSLPLRHVRATLPRASATLGLRTESGAWRQNKGRGVVSSPACRGRSRGGRAPKVPLGAAIGPPTPSQAPPACSAHCLLCWLLSALGLCKFLPLRPLLLPPRSRIPLHPHRSRCCEWVTGPLAQRKRLAMALGCPGALGPSLEALGSGWDGGKGVPPPFTDRRAGQGAPCGQTTAPLQLCAPECVPGVPAGRQGLAWGQGLG